MPSRTVCFIPPVAVAPLPVRGVVVVVLLLWILRITVACNCVAILAVHLGIQDGLDSVGTTSDALSNEMHVSVSSSLF